MARQQTVFERSIRDLHGPDIDIEVEVIDHGTGRYAPPAPKPKLSPLGWIFATIAMTPLLIFMFLLAIGGLAAVGIVILCLQAMWHIVFS